MNIAFKARKEADCEFPLTFFVRTGSPRNYMMRQAIEALDLEAVDNVDSLEDTFRVWSPQLGRYIFFLVSEQGPEAVRGVNVLGFPFLVFGDFMCCAGFTLQWEFGRKAFSWRDL